VPDPAGGNVDIVIAEDTATQAHKLRSLLEAGGFSVAWARDGRAALELVRALRPTLLISDVIMPDMDGYELCTAIRHDPGLHDLPVLIMTSLSEPTNVIDALACGASNFLTKPYDGALLLARIERILESERIRSTMTVEDGVDVVFGGERYHLESERPQIIDFLMSTFEDAAKKSVLVEKSNQKLQEMLRTIAGMEKRYRSMLEASAGAMLVVDHDGTVLYANPAAELLFRTEATTLEGKPSPFPFDGLDSSPEIDLALKDGTLAFVELRVVETDWAGQEAFLASLWDVTENVRLREKLRDLSLTDELTGLCNRRGFLSLAQLRLKVARQSGSDLVMLFSDMDGLKSINDTHGHDSGDDALRETADLMRATLRDSDILGRVGGDEFAALLVGLDDERARQIVARMELAFEGRNAQAASPYRLSISIGCVAFDPARHEGLAALMKSADELMYADKERRKGERD
jgi:two-component system cell cycle response regulator